MFFKKKIVCPILEQDKEWLDEALLWLEQELGQEYLYHKEILYPSSENFEIKSINEEADVDSLVERISHIMEVSTGKLQVKYYEEPSQIEFSEGLATEQGNYQKTTGKYIYHSDGSSEILIEKKQLAQPISLVATIAHELAHVKLISNNLIDENDEYLTDLLAIASGFGIFTANTAVPNMKTWSGSTHSGWKVIGGEGYLPYEVQSFALAMLSIYWGNEDDEWKNYLDEKVYKMVNKSFTYLSSVEAKPQFITGV